METEQEREDEVRADLLDWQGYPYTKTLAKQYSEKAQLSYECLLSTCAASGDPRVREAFAEFRELTMIALTLGGTNVRAKTFY